MRFSLVWNSSVKPAHSLMFVFFSALQRYCVSKIYLNTPIMFRECNRYLHKIIFNIAFDIIRDEFWIDSAMYKL